MESKKEINSNDKIPKERRIRTKETEGKFDDNGFFRTPNGSFWDMDGEYFNHYGFDIHGGKYVDELDYIPGPTWIEELGCYPEDEEKYKNGVIEDEGKDLEEDINLKDFENLGINDEELKKYLDNNKNEININKEEKKDKKDKKNNKKKKKKKEESFDEDEWEEIEDE